jgi:hypothetical protein
MQVVGSLAERLVLLADLQGLIQFAIVGIQKRSIKQGRGQVVPIARGPGKSLHAVQ